MKNPATSADQPTQPRKAGRPRIERTEGKTVITTPVDDTLNELAKRAAAKRGLSVASLVRLLLTDEISRLGLDKE